jgi:cytochrome c1
MKTRVLTFILALLPAISFAAGGPSVPLYDIEADHTNKESLQRGAKVYVNYCMGCHSLQYMRYERVADDLGIPHELMQQHLNFAGQEVPGQASKKIGSLMTIAADEKLQKQWFGVNPPDLSLITRLKGGPDWLYTYMLGFYKDDSRPFGVNNKVFKDVGMPHVMLDAQGMQECEKVEVTVEDHGDTKTKEVLGECKITKEGTMTAEEYEIAVYDLTNFLDYVAEPYKEDRKRIGLWALLFSLLFTIVAVFLNQEYWRDIH